MGWSDLKQKVTDHLQKKTEHKEKKDDLEESTLLFSELNSISDRLDDSILQALDGMRSSYDLEQSLLEQERALLEKERFSMLDTVKKNLENLRKAKAKLENAAQGRYAAHFRDGLNACERSIWEYQSLMDLLEGDCSLANESISHLRESLERGQTLLAETQIRADAITALTTITPGQRKAVRAYTSENNWDSYRFTNRVLRGEKMEKVLNPGTPEQRAQQREAIMTAITQLHEFLGAQRTSVPITVFRRVRDSVPMVKNGNEPNLEDLDSIHDDQLVGKMLVDGAFVSTATRENATVGSGKTMLVIDLPAGSRGAYVGDISSSGDDEREVVLDRIQKFRVTRIERRDNMRYIYCTALIQEEN